MKRVYDQREWDMKQYSILCVIVIWKRMQKLYLDLFFLCEYISFLLSKSWCARRRVPKSLIISVRSWLLHSNVFDRRQRLKVCACFIMIAIVVVVFRRVGTTTTNNDFFVRNSNLAVGVKDVGKLTLQGRNIVVNYHPHANAEKERLTYPGEKVSSAREWTSRLLHHFYKWYQWRALFVQLPAANLGRRRMFIYLFISFRHFVPLFCGYFVPPSPDNSKKKFFFLTMIPRVTLSLSNYLYF